MINLFSLELPPSFFISALLILSIYRSNNEQTGDRTQQPQSQQRAPEKKPEKTINKRLQRTQAQVNEVVDIMRVNIEKVLERDKNLSQLDDRAGETLKFDLSGWIVPNLLIRFEVDNNGMCITSFNVA